MLNRDKYLKQRAYREKSKDYRSGRDRRDYGYKYDFENEYDERDRDYRSRDRRDMQDMRDYRDYRDMRGDRDYRDYRDYRDMRDRDYRDQDYRDRDYASEDYEKEYEYDLEKWTQKLKKEDRFGLSKDKVASTAKQMGVKFEDYDENEYYTVYLMLISDYPTISNDPRMYLNMAKEWLEDKDLKIDGSTKLCKYMYEIVMAEDE